MNRRSTGEWRKELVAPGCVSLLTHAAQSHWRWSEDIEVTHLYLSPGAMANVAAEAYDCHIKDVELRDILKADDPVLAGIAASLAQEAREAGLGGRLYVNSLRNHACVHILRRYANVIFREPNRSGGLSHAQCRLLNQYFDENWSGTFSFGGACGGGGLERVSLRAQIPNRILLPATRPSHAQAHRSAPRLNWPEGISRSKWSRQQPALGPKPYDAAVPPATWNDAGRIRNAATT